MTWVLWAFLRRGVPVDANSDPSDGSGELPWPIAGPFHSACIPSPIVAEPLPLPFGIISTTFMESHKRRPRATFLPFPANRFALDSGKNRQPNCPTIDPRWSMSLQSPVWHSPVALCPSTSSAQASGNGHVSADIPQSFSLFYEKPWRPESSSPSCWLSFELRSVPTGISPSTEN
jgi:hypothetical protein